MQLTPRQRLTQFDHLFQTELFGQIEEQLGTMSAPLKLLTAVLAMTSIARWVGPAPRRGRRRKARHALAAAFLAKAVLDLPTTRRLRQQLASDSALRRLCGFAAAAALPHEATFSRAFAEFASSQLPQHLHEALVRSTQENRLIGHIARDSTAIEARERFPENPPAKYQRKPRPRGPRPKRNTPATPSTRLECQRTQKLEQMLAELPTHCSLGVKTSSKGYQSYWRGYKLHLDVADGQVPISCILTAASLHDSQVAIPLATMTAQRTPQVLYELMDAAYDAQDIREHSAGLGRVAIIDPVQRYKTTTEKVPLRKNSKSYKKVVVREALVCELAPAERLRFRERSMVERVNARLKDEFGGRHVRVRGAQKVMAHLMYGVVALTVDQLLRLLR